MWAKGRLFQSLGGGWLEQFGVGLWSRLQLTSLAARKDKRIVELITRIVREKRSLLTAFEQYLLFGLMQANTKLPGAIAEVGVYRGASARLLCEAKGDKPLYLFDTFTGLPKSTGPDRAVHKEHQYAYSLDKVQDYLQAYSGVHFHPGLF